MLCHAMHPMQDLFLESFSYELQFDMHSYLHKIFILAKSGCYTIPWPLGGGGAGQSGEQTAWAGWRRWLEHDHRVGEPFEVLGEEADHHSGSSTLFRGSWRPTRGSWMNS
jgi:hypothetical protein